jgi:hypothetical protein
VLQRVVAPEQLVAQYRPELPRVHEQATHRLQREEDRQQKKEHNHEQRHEQNEYQGHGLTFALGL